MSFLREKSNFNIDSAEELIKLNYYAPSVHCSYYGSFQYMKFALRKCKNTTYEKIESDCLNYKGGSHGFIIDNILSELRIKIKNSQDFIHIKRIIKDLKKFRTNSDYFDIQILFDDAEKSVKYSKEIIHSIKKNIIL